MAKKFFKVKFVGNGRKVTSIGRSHQTRFASKQDKRTKKKYRGQGG